MKIVCLEHSDDFDEEIIAYFQLGDIPAEYVQFGRSIDNENYMDNCFGFCMQYDVESDSCIAVEGYSDSNEEGIIYYVDNDGDKHYIPGTVVSVALLNDALSILKTDLSL